MAGVKKKKNMTGCVSACRLEQDDRKKKYKANKPTQPELSWLKSLQSLRQGDKVGGRVWGAGCISGACGPSRCRAPLPEEKNANMTLLAMKG